MTSVLSAAKASRTAATEHTTASPNVHHIRDIRPILSMARSYAETRTAYCTFSTAFIVGWRLQM